MKCTVCGTENPDNARFCGICGSPFADSETANAEPDKSIADAAITEADTEEIPAESYVTADASEPYAEPDPVAAPAEPLPSENANAGISDGQPSVPIAPMPLPDAPKQSAFSNSEYGSGFVPNNNPAPPPKSNIGRHEKEKKVVSLSVAIFCIAAVFILAVVCGVLVQLYTAKSKSTANSGTSYSSYKASEEAAACLECIL